MMRNMSDILSGTVGVGFGEWSGKLTGLSKGLDNSHKLIKLVATFRNLLFPLQAEIFCS